MSVGTSRSWTEAYFQSEHGTRRYTMVTLPLEGKAIIGRLGHPGGQAVAVVGLQFSREAFDILSGGEKVFVMRGQAILFNSSGWMSPEECMLFASRCGEKNDLVGTVDFYGDCAESNLAAFWES